MSQVAAQAEILSRPADETRTPRFRLTPYLLEAQSELLQAWRQPSFSLPTLLFSAMFYLFFGVLMGRSNGFASYLVATYGAFGVIGTSLFGFGVGIAVSRESGELRLKRVAPMPAGAFLTAKLVTALVFSAVVIAELFALAAFLGEVRFARLEWISLAAVLLAGTIPFAAMGLAIGTHTSGKGAPAIVNMIYLPMAFLSGLWVPIEALPGFLHKLAIVFPPYHFAQLALGVLGKGAGQPLLLHLAYLLIMTIICLLLATRGLRSADA